MCHFGYGDLREELGNGGGGGYHSIQRKSRKGMSDDVDELKHHPKQHGDYQWKILEDPWEDDADEKENNKAMGDRINKLNKNKENERSVMSDAVSELSAETFKR